MEMLPWQSMRRVKPQQQLLCVMHLLGHFVVVLWLNSNSLTDMAVQVMQL